MSSYKRSRPSFLAAGCVAALAVAASPAGAQSVPQAGSIGLQAGKVGSYGRISASLALPPGASMNGKVLLGKRVLCRAARKRAGTDDAPTTIGCRFPLRALVVRKSRSSQNGQYAPFVVLSIAVREALTLEGVEFPPEVPVVLTIPIAAASFEKTYG